MKQYKHIVLVAATAAKSLQSCPTLCDSTDICDPIAHQAPLSMGFSTQDHWSGVPLPSPIVLVTSLQILKKINPEYALEGLVLKLKLQYFGHQCKDLTHWKRC